jgi:predicted AlkP superfamily pyrophosphatase or phosphodiesterase
VRGFAELPARIEALAREHEQLAVVLLDAFGWAFVQRHADHPLLQRLEIEPIASQFPSTTTAHLTTLYSGLPVEEHGLYEWRTYEPAVGDVIRPILFAPARDGDPPLRITPQTMFPFETIFQRIDATVLQPEEIANTAYGSVAFAGAVEIVPFRGIERAVAALKTMPGVTFLYWDRIDALGHKFGPSSPEFVTASLRALDALESIETPMLVTADHGQIDVTVTDELDMLWPELTRHVRMHPAGSARDLFLHVDDPELVVRELGARMEGRGEVRLARELFPDAGPRLIERLADVCVLPAPGRMAALSAAAGPEQAFRGHHGGLTPEESETWVGLQA